MLLEVTFPKEAAISLGGSPINAQLLTPNISPTRRSAD
jgi:hypothetical protein